MTTSDQPYSQPSGWLDSFAIGMSVICAIHCMVTPVLVAVLPVVASTFWVHKDFHLWMLLLVVPMAGISLFLGCRKHKSKGVMVLGIIGLIFLISVAANESLNHSSLVQQGDIYCLHCTQCETKGLFDPTTLANILGAIFLTGAHTRNFLLCRKAKRCH